MRVVVRTLCPLHIASVVFQVSGFFCATSFGGCVACANVSLSLLGVLVAKTQAFFVESCILASLLWCCKVQNTNLYNFVFGLQIALHFYIFWPNLENFQKFVFWGPRKFAPKCGVVELHLVSGVLL